MLVGLSHYPVTVILLPEPLYGLVGIIAFAISVEFHIPEIPFVMARVLVGKFTVTDLVVDLFTLIYLSVGACKFTFADTFTVDDLTFVDVAVRVCDSLLPLGR